MLVKIVVDTGTIRVVTDPRAGQSVTEAAQEVTVYTLVAYTVEVISCTDEIE